MLRIGVVGCGEVAQIIHLPALAQLPEQFRVTALCDVSAKVLAGVGDAWGVAARCTDFRELVSRPDVDSVLIANPHVYHAEVALAAMAAGKHVMIEKPMCITLADADAIIAARQRAGVVAQVGYMRRYAPAFLEAVALVKALPEIRLARVHAVIGRNALIIGDTSRVVRGDDLPASAGERLAALQTERVTAAIGPADADLRAAYLLLLGLSSHDLSAMREMLGVPRRVLFAQHRWEGRWLAAAFDYGDYVCQFETGIDQIPRFDAYIEVYSAERCVRVEYDTPYVRNLPARLVVTEPRSTHGAAVTSSFPGRRDSFVLEWLAFHDNVSKARSPKTTPEDARQDLVLFREMIERMR
jgi:predicted dehydrogenase